MALSDHTRNTTLKAKKSAAVYSEGGSHVASVTPYTPAPMEYAQLFAAAPDLLSALRGVLTAYVPNCSGNEHSDIGGTVMYARLAIRKAEGEQ